MNGKRLGIRWKVFLSPQITPQDFTPFVRGDAGWVCIPLKAQVRSSLGVFVDPALLLVMEVARPRVPFDMRTASLPCLYKSDLATIIHSLVTSRLRKTF